MRVETRRDSRGRHRRAAGPGGVVRRIQAKLILWRLARGRGADEGARIGGQLLVQSLAGLTRAGDGPAAFDEAVAFYEKTIELNPKLAEAARTEYSLSPDSDVCTSTPGCRIS